MVTREFTCQDCGDSVIQFGPRPDEPEVCATCQWIRNLPNEHDRMRAREFLSRHRTNGDANAD